MCFTDPWMILVYLAGANIVLSGIHWILMQLKAKTDSKFDDRADAVVTFLLEMIEWIMAAGRRPK